MIGVIVIELGKEAGGVVEIGMISKLGLRSRPNMDDRLDPGVDALAELIGVILTEDGI